MGRPKGSKNKNKNIEEVERDGRYPYIPKEIANIKVIGDGNRVGIYKYNKEEDMTIIKNYKLTPQITGEYRLENMFEYYSLPGNILNL